MFTFKEICAELGVSKTTLHDKLQPIKLLLKKFDPKKRKRLITPEEKEFIINYYKSLPKRKPKQEKEVS